MNREQFRHLTDDQWAMAEAMQPIFGPALREILSSDPKVQSSRLNAFAGMFAKTAADATAEARAERPLQQKPVRLAVAKFDGKEGENLPRWLREVEVAAMAQLILSDKLRIAFAMSHMGGRAKDWAFTKILADEHAFPTWEMFVEELRKAFLPPNVDFRQRARFLACKQGKRSLHPNVQELREIAASISTHPLPEDVKVTVFMEGMRVGPVRTQLFREIPSTLEKAIAIAFGEDHSQRQASGNSHLGTSSGGGGAEPMDIGQVELARARGASKNVTCHRCGKKGHYRRDCRVNLSRGKKGASSTSGGSQTALPVGKSQGNAQTQ